MKHLNIELVMQITGLTQKEIAKAIGCSEMWLSHSRDSKHYSKTFRLIDSLLYMSGLTYEELVVNESTEDWIERVINSCKTPEQKEIAMKLKENYNNQNK